MRLAFILTTVFLLIGLAPWIIQATASGLAVLFFTLLFLAFRLLVIAIAALPALWLIRKVIYKR